MTKGSQISPAHPPEQTMRGATPERHSAAA